MSAINTAFTGFDQSMLAFLVPLQPCHVLPAVVQPEKESVQPGARVCRKRAEACCTQNDSTPLENSPGGSRFPRCYRWQPQHSVFHWSFLGGTSMRGEPMNFPRSIAPKKRVQDSAEAVQHQCRNSAALDFGPGILQKWPARSKVGG
jgi:hypothetical protein